MENQFNQIHTQHLGDYGDDFSVEESDEEINESDDDGKDLNEDNTQEKYHSGL